MAMAMAMTMGMKRGLQSGPATPHPDYLAAIDTWQKCRDVHDGADAVKARREAYLPRPEGMTDADYGKYLLRAGFIPASSRTEEVLSGLLFATDPEVAAPVELSDFLTDATLASQPFVGLAQDLVSDVLVAGRAVLLMDFAIGEDGAPRPYASIRPAEDMVSWHTEQAVDGRESVLRVAFRETALVPVGEYGVVVENRVREYLVEEDYGGVVVIEHAHRDGKWVRMDIRPLVLYGQPLERIPVVVANARRVGYRVERPPLAAIADLVLSHYRSSADLEQGNYFASLPTVYTVGGRMQGAAARQRARVPTHGGFPVLDRGQGYQGYRLGSNTVLELPQGTSIGYLEIAGPGLSSIHQTLERKERQLAAVGARLIQDQQAQAETAQTARIKAQSDASLLRLIANVADQALTQALAIAAEWMGHPDADVSVTLDRSQLDDPGAAPDNPLSIDNWPVE